MVILRLVLLLSLIATPCFGQMYARMNPYVAGAVTVAAANECDGYAICQNFEGTGYDNSESWTATGDPDYATTALRGSQSFAMDNFAENGTSPALADLTDAWIFFRFQVSDETPGSPSYLVNLRSDTTNLCRFSIRSDALPSHFNGTANQTASAGKEIAANTEYCVWMQCNVGATANSGHTHTWMDACATVCADGTCTRPASEYMTAVTSGTWDDDPALAANNLYLYANSSSETYIVDQVLVKTTEISDVPD